MLGSCYFCVCFANSKYIVDSFIYQYYITDFVYCFNNMISTVRNHWKYHPHSKRHSVDIYFCSEKTILIGYGLFVNRFFNISVIHLKFVLLGLYERFLIKSREIVYKEIANVFNNIVHEHFLSIDIFRDILKKVFFVS